MRLLPNFIAPKKINETLKQLRVTANTSTITQKSPKKERLLDAEYVSDPYGLSENQRRLDYKSSKDKNVSPLPFVSTTVPKSEKQKDLRGKADPLIKYIESPYDALKEKKAQEKWAKRLKFLHGEFKPAPKEHNLQKISRSLLPDIMAQLRKTLEHDWPDTEFAVSCTFAHSIGNPEDCIEVTFGVGRVDSLLGLHAYMNHVVTSDASLSAFQLKKVNRYWGLKEGDFAYYMLAPPWIKLNPKEEISIMHAGGSRNNSMYAQKSSFMKFYSKDMNPS